MPPLSRALPCRNRGPVPSCRGGEGLRDRNFVLLVVLGGPVAVLSPAGLRRAPPTPGRWKGNVNCDAQKPGWLGFVRPVCPVCRRSGTSRADHRQGRQLWLSCGGSAVLAFGRSPWVDRRRSVGGPVLRVTLGGLSAVASWSGSGLRFAVCCRLCGGGPADDLHPCGRVDGIRGSQAVTCAGACALRTKARRGRAWGCSRSLRLWWLSRAGKGPPETQGS